ncbi:hypothetical protein CHS0354_031616 [Potamilus streckersoni]|uniref:Uncharacterized protein n=1 Tax=Potamilus streckersoni TaxID=2493646 RepID=A0AAE0VVH8_9BIVA|nr:hypothetical protein CHS0354_031616 [Potamilus streckersoni]
MKTRHPIYVPVEACISKMKTVAPFFVVYLMQYVQSVPTDSEIVWLKDVTSRFRIDKRSHDSDLPDELIFHVRRGSGALTLNLKKNHGINPNADIYFVRKHKDGQSLLEKSENLEMENCIDGASKKLFRYATRIELHRWSSSSCLDILLEMKCIDGALYAIEIYYKNTIVLMEHFKLFGIEHNCIDGASNKLFRYTTRKEFYR